MRQRIAWQLPDHLYRSSIKGAHRRIIRFGLRLMVLAMGTGAIGILVIQWFAPNLDPKVFRAMWMGVYFMPGMLFFCYILQVVVWAVAWRWKEARPTLCVSSGGVGLSDSARSWKKFSAFNLEPHPMVMGERVLKFYGKHGFHLTRTLPGDEKDDLIIRFVAKHLPLLEEHADPELIMREPNPPPRWLIGTVMVMTVLVCLPVGFFVWGSVGRDLRELILYGCMLVNPGTIVGVVGSVSGWFKKRRVSYWPWCLVFSMLAAISVVIGCVLRP